MKSRYLLSVGRSHVSLLSNVFWSCKQYIWSRLKWKCLIFFFFLMKTSVIQSILIPTIICSSSKLWVFYYSILLIIQILPYLVNRGYKPVRFLRNANNSLLYYFLYSLKFPLRGVHSSFLKRMVKHKMSLLWILWQ